MRVLDPKEACNSQISWNKSIGICFAGLANYFSAFLSFYSIPKSPSERKMGLGCCNLTKNLAIYRRRKEFQNYIHGGIRGLHWNLNWRANHATFSRSCHRLLYRHETLPNPDAPVSCETVLPRNLLLWTGSKYASRTKVCVNHIDPNLQYNPRLTHYFF